MMAPTKRDPKVAALRAIDRSKASLARAESMVEQARRQHRANLLAASRAGVSGAELARRYGTSESRIRQTLNRAQAEDE